LVALPILSSDALSSVAYGPEAMLAVLTTIASDKPSDRPSAPVPASAE
jgi:hypothetical protein